MLYKMGGSILPVTFHNNQIYFLFGKERDNDENPGWSDFGGGTEKGESFINTAIREGSEELTGFLGSPKDIKQLLNKYGTYHVDYNSQGHTTYRVHIFPMEYDDKLIFYYNNNQRFLQKKLDPKIIEDQKIFEKTEIQWFTFEELKNKKHIFRSFYQNIVPLFLNQKTQITHFIESNLKNISNNKKTIKTRKTKKTKKTKKIN